MRVIDTAGPCQARPVAGNVTSPYGYRVHPITGRWTLHTGIDFGARSGTHIHACRGGTVVRASWYGGYGNAIIVDHGGGMQTLYAHQSAFAVGAGARVAAGQHIGYVGSTGNSTGPHLHFEVYINGRTVDPARGLPWALPDTVVAPPRGAVRLIKRWGTAAAPAGRGRRSRSRRGGRGTPGSSTRRGTPARRSRRRGRGRRRGCPSRRR